MSEQITIILKRKLDDLSAYENIDAETLRNALKEDLQFYVLNFVYHHPEYSKWIMYGGSALRIIHGLDRMSVDLDFEVSHGVSETFLEKLKKEVENYFINTYGADNDFLTTKITNERGLLLKFHVGKELRLGHPSNQVHVKIDLNNFIAPKTVTERRPINRDQLSFVILTYNMSALMASKIAAIFLRGARGAGTAVYEEKGRDVYDLLWYMGKKVVPDFDYMIAKGIDVNDPRILFDKLTLQMNKVSDKNLKNDLIPLFVDQIFISNWLKNWRESYLRLLNDYKIRAIKELEDINIYQDFNNDIFSFIYSFKTDDNSSIRIIYHISDCWMEFRDGDINTEVDKKIEDKIKFNSNDWSSRPTPQDRLKQYTDLFYKKTEKYFKKTNNILLGDVITTKVIRMTADNLNQKEQIVLNKSALLSCELDDLLK
ncbi:nucleotidyl transferase AbiEii/AbiGii toxin family protein [Patescibacteria group bacterium]|nr:nucleotidyl transferase AbiEii/AbiGii toxin family protein [Patescibacteria group bacterium]MBU0879494.1 nucleotidyl transferase AbiEii/AbiGii toxin family protein [Patescibacteria group bacterium]MBU0880050.1 nucleotidyl transferase AbiEii/AbiGii toxin family protein [Patescibacteria group bacterium]MBU1062558.1 nucleotidyl transferase AbiEii/AbiGii toxin family protein [Patescibacteria group bacterium]MBU1991684.1 nucleotidyl transferase AbiEii/AbiGii toxin family protein [Patescibacteria 